MTQSNDRDELATLRAENERLSKAIAQAAELYEQVRSSETEYHAPWDAFDAWLELPVVKSARKASNDDVSHQTSTVLDQPATPKKKCPRI